MSHSPAAHSISDAGDAAAIAAAASRIARPVAHRLGIHLWQLDLALPGDAALLSPDEQARAARLIAPARRQQFIAARAGLRRLLGAYTGIAPAALTFVYGDEGKPALAEPAPLAAFGLHESGTLHFNLAHSGDIALVGLARRPLGIDLETIRPLAALDQMAPMIFSAQEQAALAALPSAQQLGAFFRGWARKEALMKADGGGFKRAASFSLPLASFTTETPLLAQVAGWQLCDLALGEAFAAALATQADAP